MAIIETNRSVPFGAVITYRFVNMIDALRQRVMNAYQTSKTEKALSNLSNEQLRDIGVERAEINAAAKRAFYL